jgi:thiamine kinase
MAATLPHDGELRLAQVLAQWRHWDCDPPLAAAPSPAGSLDPGHSNRSYRVQAADGRAFVVRLDGIEAAHHGISRRTEWHALKQAHARGLAPRPCFLHPALGALVCEYLPPDDGAAQAPTEVAALLRAIHRLPPLHYRLDLGERIARYRHQVARLAPERLAALAPFAAAVDALLQYQRDWQRATGEPRVLCHNDLLAANRLASGGRLFALDWEYCAMGSRWFDLAVVCCGDPWSEDEREALLGAYLQRPPTPTERQHLARCGLLYRYLELLWFACVDTGQYDWPGKLAGLEQALRAQAGPGGV